MAEPETVAELTGGALDIPSYRKQLQNIPDGMQRLMSGCRRQQTMARQFAFGSSVIAAAGATNEAWQKDLNRLLMQGLKGTRLRPSSTVR